MTSGGTLPPEAKDGGDTFGAPTTTFALFGANAWLARNPQKTSEKAKSSVDRLGANNRRMPDNEFIMPVRGRAKVKSRLRPILRSYIQ
jgi:hypothetical protein